MPNWIHNEVTFTHSDPHKLEEMADIFRESDRPFDQLIPEPDWPNVPAASNIKDSAGNPVAKKGELPKKIVLKLASGGESINYEWPSSGRQDARWYDWRRKHWGCKWNPSDVEVNFQMAANLVHMNFNTPWNPPRGVYEKLCEMGYEFINWQYQDECEEEIHYLVPLEVVA